MENPYEPSSVATKPIDYPAAWNGAAGYSDHYSLTNQPIELRLGIVFTLEFALLIVCAVLSGHWRDTHVHDDFIIRHHR